MKKTFFAAVFALIAFAAPQAAGYYTVSELMDIYNSLGLSSGTTSSDSYTVRGYVTSWKSGYPNYQNADFFIDDSATGSTSLLECFRLKGQETSDQRTLSVGEYIEATAKLQNYNGRAELCNGTYRVLPNTFTLTIIAGTGGTVNSEVNGEYAKGAQVTITATPNADYTFVKWSDGNTQATRTITMTEDVTLSAEFKGLFNTISDLMAIYNSLGLASGSKSTDSYTARGYVTSWKSGYPSYQNADFFVDDYADGSTSQLECFRLIASNDADKRTLAVGEYVEFTGKLQNYNGRAEVCDGTFRVMEAPQQPSSGDCYVEYVGMKGADILVALHNAIKDHTVLDYDAIRADKTGVDYRADGSIWDMYSDCSFTAKGYCGYNQEVTAECDCYNREHVLPQSWWGNDNTQPMRTDLHHVIPTDALSNSNRSAWPYGEVSGTATWTNSAGAKLGYGTFGTSGNNYVFEPVDEYKGDIARIYFYMITCYRDKNLCSGGKGYQVFNYTNSVLTFTDKAKSLFLKWHRNDPVSEKEINRNNGVAKKQGNRNPFVDAPDLVEYIWGNKTSQTYVCQSLQGVEEIETAPRATKLLENGQLFIILPDGTRYSVMGERVR